MSDQKTYEKIEAYLNGELKGKELSDFEQQIQSDKELADQVSLFKELDSALEDKSALNFQKLVEEQGAAYLNKPKEKQATTRIIKWKRYIPFAAMFVFLISALFIWKSQLNTDVSNDVLYARHFETYNLNESLRGGDSTDEKLNIAIQKYQSQAYKESSDIFQELIAENNSNMSIAFGLAQSSLNQKPKNLAVAKAQFERIITEGNSIYVPTSKWYLALILIAQNDRPAAREVLLDLKKEEGNYRGKAIELLDEIDD